MRARTEDAQSSEYEIQKSLDGNSDPFKKSPLRAKPTSLRSNSLAKTLRLARMQIAALKPPATAATIDSSRER